jgi:hypothetical protein
MEIAPQIGWSNAIPDSISNANFTVGGEDFSFTGYGYHDKVSSFCLWTHFLLTANWICV